MQLVYDRGLADTRVAGNQYELRRAARHDPVESFEQRLAGRPIHNADLVLYGGLGTMVCWRSCSNSKPNRSRRRLSPIRVLQRFLYGAESFDRPAGGGVKNTQQKTRRRMRAVGFGRQTTQCKA